MLVVVFRIGDAFYAIRCQTIVEVIPQVPLSGVPRGPSWLSGTFTYRGELTPVVDLCQLICGYTCPARLSSRIILVRCALPEGSARLTGLLAEHVTEARQLNASALPAATLATAPYFGPVFIEDGKPLQMLDAERILLGAGAAFAQQAPARLGTGEEDRSFSES